MGGALEEGMLDKVCDTLLRGAFVTGTYIDVYARMGDDRVVLTKDDAYTVGKSMILVQGCKSFC